VPQQAANIHHLAYVVGLVHREKTHHPADGSIEAWRWLWCRRGHRFGVSRFKSEWKNGREFFPCKKNLFSLGVFHGFSGLGAALKLL
jgi:hypothetical protein